MIVEPQGDAVAFGPHYLHAVASSWADDDRCAVGLGRAMDMDPSVLFLELAFPNRGVIVPQRKAFRLGYRVEAGKDDEGQ